jgi:hypothetical protein
MWRSVTESRSHRRMTIIVLFIPYYFDGHYRVIQFWVFIYTAKASDLQIVMELGRSILTDRTKQIIGIQLRARIVSELYSNVINYEK